MAQSIIARTSAFGVGVETTVGTRAAPTLGLTNMNKATIKPGQQWADDMKMHGLAWAHVIEKVADRKLATFAPESVFNVGDMGMFLAGLCQQVSQSGAGPYEQDVSFSGVGRSVTLGEAAAIGARTFTILEKFGQSGNRNVAMLGAVCTEAVLTIGAGRIKPALVFQSMGLALDDAGTGTVTLNTGPDIRGRDVVMKLGDGVPTVLLSAETVLTIRALVEPKYYAGQNNGNPYRFVFHGWEGEIKFKKPLEATVDMFTKSNIYDASSDMLMYIYSRTLADYSTALTAGQFRFTLNLSAEDAEIEMNDEVTESITAKLRFDGANSPFLYEQATAASQTWAV